MQRMGMVLGLKPEKVDGVCAPACRRLAGRAGHDLGLQHQELFDLPEASRRTCCSATSNITAPISPPTWRRWRPTPRRRNGGRSACRARSRSRRARKANGGRRWTRSSIMTDGDFDPAHRSRAILAAAVEAAADRHLRRRVDRRRRAFSGLPQGRLPGRRPLRSRPAPRREKLADAWGVTAFGSVEEAAAVKDAIFDLATPPARHADVLQALPDGAVALIQKPMGSDLAEATDILEICRAKKLKAAVNFQLRFAPMMLALKDAIAKGWLGEVVDFDAWLALATPWQLWAFLLKAPRVEIAMHSIHYLDLIRAAARRPARRARQDDRPSRPRRSRRRAPAPSSTMATRVRCALSINHDHKFGRRHQACEFRICGTEGAAYLQARPQSRLSARRAGHPGDPSEGRRRTGSPCRWPAPGFPDAFVGRMANVQRFAAGEDAELVSSGRGCLEHDGAGRGRLPVERRAGDAARERGPDGTDDYFEDYEIGTSRTDHRPHHHRDRLRRPCRPHRRFLPAPHGRRVHEDDAVRPAHRAWHDGLLDRRRADGDRRSTRSPSPTATTGCASSSRCSSATRSRPAPPSPPRKTIRSGRTRAASIERCEVINQRGEVVLAADHIYIVERRDKSM